MQQGFGPKAPVFGKLNPVMVQGAVLARPTISEGGSEDPLQSLKTGDRVRVDPQAKTMTLLAAA